MHLTTPIKGLTAILILVLLTGLGMAEEHDIIVVANIDDTSLKLSKLEVRNLFMGHASDTALEPVSLPPQTLARAIFNTKVIGLTESRIQSYWSQMRFSGRARAPKEMPTVEELMTYVSNNKGTVAFVPANTKIPPHLTVVFLTAKM